MKKENRTGSHLFFIEFLIVLFFFLIVSTVCLRMFARAHGITRRADALSHAQAAAASVAAAAEQAIADGPEISDDGNSGVTGSAAVEDSPISDPDAAEPAAQADGSWLLRRMAEYLPDAFLTNLPSGAETRECLAIPYDEGFQPCDLEDAHYLLTAVPGMSGETTAPETDGENATPGTDEENISGETLEISVHDYDQNLLYELSVSFHRPMTRKEALR